MIRVNAAGDGWDAVGSAGNFEFAAAGAEDNARVTVSNEPGASLPQTGGPGTSLVYLLGIMLTGFAGAGLMMRERRKDI